MNRSPVRMGLAAFWKGEVTPRRGLLAYHIGRAFGITALALFALLLLEITR